VLILGTLPGTVSLARGEYYAQPRNAFWRIMSELGGAPVDAPYPDRTRRLMEIGIALWDVCAAAKRIGALDAAIDHSTVVSNDFTSFLDRHPAIAVICFNGATAAKLYGRKVVPHLPARFQSIRRKALPSTSPAHAAMAFAEKLAIWREALSGPLGSS
jgi:hypoxanthine-DNA glycosylase